MILPSMSVTTSITAGASAASAGLSRVKKHNTISARTDDFLNLSSNPKKKPAHHLGKGLTSYTDTS